MADCPSKIEFNLRPLQTALAKYSLRHGRKLSEAEKLAGMKPGELHDQLENPPDENDDTSHGTVLNK